MKQIIPPSRILDGQTYFTNLPALVTSGLPPVAGMGAGWSPFEYELDCFPGIGLITGAFSPAGELVLDLGLTGWHRLYLAHNPCIRVWLDGDKGYVEVRGNPSGISEYSFPAADFTGRRLHLAPKRGSEVSEPVTLFYLRAEPCESYRSRRNLVGTNDGHMPFFRGVDTPRDLYRYVTPYADSDFFRLLWGVYGGGPLTLNPATRVGESPIWAEGTAYRAGDEYFNRSLARMRDAGADPLAVIRDATREIGLELHYYYRMAAFYGPFPLSGRTTDFFQNHPEWHCRDEFGNKVNFISYAYHQVQDHVLAYFEELLDYDPEGICLAFNRGLPMMICEEPVLDAYHRRHGRRPRLPEEIDTPELQAVRQDMLADFVARARHLTEKRGKALSCIAPRNFERSRLLGLDLERLLQRGLVDSAMIGAGHKDVPAMNAELEPLRALRRHGVPMYAGGSNVKAHGGAWVNGDLQARARYMAAILDAGLDGGFFWDADHNVIDLEWSAMRRFGDRAYLESVIRGDEPKPVSRQTLRLQDLIVGRYSPWNAY
jgi:hypothetical protein